MRHKLLGAYMRKSAIIIVPMYIYMYVITVDV